MNLWGLNDKHEYDANCVHEDLAYFNVSSTSYMKTLLIKIGLRTFCFTSMSNLISTLIYEGHAVA
jgi:hypothetical protein